LTVAPPRPPQAPTAASSAFFMLAAANTTTSWARAPVAGIATMTASAAQAAATLQRIPTLHSMYPDRYIDGTSAAIPPERRRRRPRSAGAGRMGGRIA
jgi:hypothetical protein